MVAHVNKDIPSLPIGIIFLKFRSKKMKWLSLVTSSTYFNTYFNDEIVSQSICYLIIKIIIGNGDVLGYEDYYHRLENEHLDGVMIGRGALVYNDIIIFSFKFVNS
jgi:hypothetical protein